MDTLVTSLVVVAVVTAVIAWSWQFHFWSPRSRNPLWIGFSATGTSALFLVAGLTGADLRQHTGSITRIAFTGHVIWWQVAVGVVLAAVGIALLRRGVRDVNRKLRRTSAG